MDSPSQHCTATSRLKELTIQNDPRSDYNLNLEVADLLSRICNKRLMRLDLARHLLTPAAPTDRSVLYFHWPRPGFFMWRHQRRHAARFGKPASEASVQMGIIFPPTVAATLVWTRSLMQRSPTEARYYWASSCLPSFSQDSSNLGWKNTVWGSIPQRAAEPGLHQDTLIFPQPAWH